MAKSDREHAYYTDRELAALAPAKPGKRYIAWDAGQPALGVRVTDRLREDPDKKMRPHRAFIVVRRRPGDRQPVYHVIGRYPEMKLAEARTKAKEVLGVLASGKHPSEIEEERRREEARKRADTFGAVADEFIKRHVQRLRSARATEVLIRRELLGQTLRRSTGEDGKPIQVWIDQKDARWRDRPIAEITRRDAVELVEMIADRGSRHQARKTFRAASKMFSWMLSRDTYGIEHSPLAQVKVADLLGAFGPRARVLTADELRLVWRAAGGMGHPFGTVIKALLLTGQRLREIADARWSEVDLDKAVLTVPAERMKAKVAHTVPLTPAVVALLKDVPRFDGGDYIFTMSAGKRPVGGFGKTKARIDIACAGMVPWVIHDIRRTVRTRLSGLKVLPLVAELVIGHKQAGIHATYDLHTYDAEKRDALLRWERALLSIVEPPKEEPARVVAMRRGKRS